MRAKRSKFENPPAVELIQEYIDTAYDDVKLVADNIEAIINLGQVILDPNNDIATEEYVRTYVEGAVDGLYQHIGPYNADTNVPDLTTSGGLIQAGYTWTCDEAGTAFYGVELSPGDLLISNVDSPTQLEDWTVVNRNIDEDAFATASQGALADSALQPGSNISELVNDLGFITSQLTDVEIKDAFTREVPVATVSEAQSGTVTAVRQFSPALIADAIAALGGGGSGDVEEAPLDGKQYARKLGAWDEIQAEELGNGQTYLGTITQLEVDNFGRVISAQTGESGNTATDPSLVFAYKGMRGYEIECDGVISTEVEEIVNYDTINFPNPQDITGNLIYRTYLPAEASVGDLSIICVLIRPDLSDVLAEFSPPTGYSLIYSELMENWPGYSANKYTYSVYSKRITQADIDSSEIVFDSFTNLINAGFLFLDVAINSFCFTNAKISSVEPAVYTATSDTDQVSSYDYVGNSVEKGIALFPIFNVLGLNGQQNNVEPNDSVIFKISKKITPNPPTSADNFSDASRFQTFINYPGNSKFNVSWSSGSLTRGQYIFRINIVPLFEGNPGYLNEKTISANYTLELEDSGSILKVDALGPVTITLPTDVTSSIANKTRIDVLKLSDTPVNFVAESGATLLVVGSNTNMGEQNSAVSLTKVSQDTWSLIGGVA